MKPLIPVILACFITAQVFAQTSSRIIYPMPEYDLFKQDQSVAKNILVYDQKKQQNVLLYRYELNQNKQLTRVVGYTKSGKMKSEVLKTYNDSNNLVEERTFVKGKWKLTRKVTYAADGKTLLRNAYYKLQLSEPHLLSIFTYDSNGKYASHERYEDGKKVFRYEFDYYPNGSKKETRYYNGKGKLKTTTLYACDWTPEQTKTTTQQCSNRAYNADSSFTEVIEIKSSKRQYTRYIKADRNGYVQEIFYLNNKNKQQGKTTYTYDDQRQLKKVIHYSGKLAKAESIELYEYAHNQLASSSRIGKNGSVVYKRTYTYE